MPPKPRPIIERWREKVLFGTDDECWEWQGAKLPKGYGRMNVGARGLGLIATHRVAYEHYVGPIPDGYHIDHLCRNPSCQNPAHLEAVTPRINILRGRTLPAENFLKTHCIRGHEFSDENTYVNPNSGKRMCRECSRARDLARYASRYAERKRKWQEAARLRALADADA